MLDFWEDKRGKGGGLRRGGGGMLGEDVSIVGDASAGGCEFLLCGRMERAH